jgi:murein DD-endopeptidase MepM/ murein hydrolase activator NlpD
VARRLGIPLLVILVLAGSASAGDVNDRKRAVDARISGLHGKIAAARQRESALSSLIAVKTAHIRALEGDVARAEARLVRLEGELGRYRARVRKLTALYRVQTRRLRQLRRQLAIAQRRLNVRLVAIYESNDPSALEVVLTSENFTDVLDRLDYLNDLGVQDRLVAEQFAAARHRVQVSRARTRRTRASVARTARAVAVRVAAQRAERDRLLASRRDLTSAREDERRTLASVHEDKRAYLDEVEGLERESASLGAQIRAAQAAAARRTPTPPPASAATPSSPSTSPSQPSSHGLIWPVHGPVVSPFGMRWGRMHTGIDIAAPTGTPIVAAAAGSVIYAGWMSGYGNLSVVDHGGGLATAYAHQSSIAVGVGASVAQGQVIGYVGCTGHCFGPHLHFEVRVNGTPVDPLGYL